MGESKERLLKAIKHYQDSLVKHTKTGNSQKLIHAIEKLGLLPIRVCHLQETGVGRTVNSLKKFDGSVGENARTLVDKWKYMVQEEEEKERLQKEQQETKLQNCSEAEESDDDALKIVDEEQTRDKKATVGSKDDNSSSHHKPSNSTRMREIDPKSNRHKSNKSHTSSRHHDDSDSSNSSNKKSSESDSSNSKSSSSSSESSDNEQTSGSDSDESAKYKSKNKSSSKSYSSAALEPKQKVSNNNSKSHDAKEASSRNKDSEKREKKDDVSKRKRHRSKSPKVDTKRRKTESKSKHHEEHNDSKHGRNKKKDYHNKSGSHKSSSKESSSQHSSNSKRGEDSVQESKRHKTEHSASTSSKDTKRDKNRSHIEKEGANKSEPKRSSDNKSKHSKPSLSNSKSLNSVNKLSEGIDSGSGTSFADVLGMLQVPAYNKNKKKSVGSEEKSTTPKEDNKQQKARPNAEISSPSPNGAIPNLLKDQVGLQPLDINVSNLLPSITPNYKPLGLPLDNQNRKVWTDDEALTRVITAKHQRTKVYSGNKSGYTKVPTLFEICTRILQENLDALEYTGGVPYSVLKPVLERASPDQLYQLEFHNPYLVEDTDELWQLHCQKEFRNKNREELESWREMYLRCLDEREAKLKALTANIKQSQDKSLPVRQTKLAYVDSVVKPPRNIARKQAKNGIAVNIKRPLVTPSERLIQISKAGDNEKVAVPNPRRAAVERGSSSSHNTQVKPKKAPLMAKTLSLLKNRFGRR